MTGSPALDRTDLRLLALLQRDGRATNADIAAQVNLSPSACLRRIQRLEATGVIAGYAARVDPKAIGMGLQAFVRVQLEKHDPASVQLFGDGVRAWDEVVACYALTGDMDYLLHVVVQDLEHFSRFLLDNLLNASGVADVNSSFVLRAVKTDAGLPLPKA
ncbi:MULTISPECIES: Lrp/AsnC family transcriptional regulator [Pseudoxanthomonas]|jgi:Lrp/AsnC family leucine-responsive transcriptional regulator|uniref:AsnC family transcriptional regulator n=1 Tax=Pseudoxanthomonas japonensis TaxID=69284 RepID=A0ABQ6ZMC0_9GAMM|nr:MULTISPECIES: Lrp/AsnC family transcriptional regulator [Pseudoxanthomonas]KAF1727511.1 AsnC family transcriptional regulator [Pseudoxanthomonas japonensis]MCR6625645.1 Lrp/AsnC family transcriptional regulator [Pseudoxanthomonas sp.]NCT71738.1 Lrp/AsnC family transcriptional regulator [Xanthomonadaceae bacterium]